MSGLWDWFWDVLFQLGLWSKNATILLLGLDNAGKTTLLYKLKNRSLKMFIPTQRAQLDEVTYGNVKFRAWDLGGHDQVRILWKDYFFEADSFIFVVDVSDQGRYQEAKNELHSLLKDDHVGNAPILIFGNKIDLKPEMTREELLEILELKPIMNKRRDIEVFLCSLLRDDKFSEGFSWLSGVL